MLIYAALLSGHWLGDHWAQSDHQAATKGQQDTAGRRSCAAHVATLTVCQGVMLALVAVAGDEVVGPLQAGLGLAVNAFSHYWADRRRTLEGLAWALGRHGYYTRAPGAMDQAWHMGWMLPAALIIAEPDPAAAAALAALCLLLLYLAEMASRAGWDKARTVRS
ncbi:DUF3307 domain-containing protein [Nocardiopsis algeriensis]|uniref:DUF3307 domain-containing protein n=1 Tax=Nocardiopsis algeriensis TaxID=1478215 RepID=A0A841IVJ4_9ACTN|nr:DUF3307 domain-containing protein [Nocardiopsis algeriensis]MBB6122192.1 hypothetical protein [Nocardiopsis algeriensis]